MKVFLTVRALKNFHAIKGYITDEWGEKVAGIFETKTLNFLELLVYFPEIESIEVLSKNIRGFQLTKQTRLFYRIKMDKIIILTFFDVGQSPNKKPR